MRISRVLHRDLILLGKCLPRRSLEDLPPRRHEPRRYIQTLIFLQVIYLQHMGSFVQP